MLGKESTRFFHSKFKFSISPFLDINFKKIVPSIRKFMIYIPKLHLGITYVFPRQGGGEFFKKRRGGTIVIEVFSNT